MSAHLCRARGCDVSVPSKMFVCKRHWFALPKPLRDAIWREYRPGQENDKNPSARYMAVQRRAIGVLLFKPNNERAAALAAPYFLESEVWRQRAIEAGDGDPLEGIAT